MWLSLPLSPTLDLTPGPHSCLLLPQLTWLSTLVLCPFSISASVFSFHSLFLSLSISPPQLFPISPISLFPLSLVLLCLFLSLLVLPLSVSYSLPSCLCFSVFPVYISLFLSLFLCFSPSTPAITSLSSPPLLHPPLFSPLSYSIRPNIFVGRAEGSTQYGKWYFEVMVDEVTPFLTAQATHLRVGWALTEGYSPYPGGGEGWGGNGVGDDLYSYGFDGLHLWTGI